MQLIIQESLDRTLLQVGSVPFWSVSTVCMEALYWMHSEGTTFCSASSKVERFTPLNSCGPPSHSSKPKFFKTSPLLPHSSTLQSNVKPVSPPCTTSSRVNQTQLCPVCAAQAASDWSLSLHQYTLQQLQSNSAICRHIDAADTVVTARGLYVHIPCDQWMLLPQYISYPQCIQGSEGIRP